MRATQETMEAAVRTYQPKNYQGKVLLILPSERPFHGNALPGWQSVISRNAHLLYLDGNHRELLHGENILRVADTITGLLHR
jgi:thioesterase domain-containing protein